MLGFDMGLYAGEFRHNRDAKGRLTVPSKWRFDGDDSQIFLAFPDPVGCVTVYPPKMVHKMKEKLSDVALGDAKGQRAIMQLFGQADSFTLDKSGRIKITDKLYEHAGIGKAVVCVGTVNKFHFWEPERYQKYLSASETEGGNLTEVLGSLGL